MKILNFNDYSDIEYRKGSQKYGGLITKLMEFLRIYKKDNNSLIFNISDFEKKSNINISEINDLLSYENKNNLINFSIEIENDKIKFDNLTKDKSRFFESVEESIRKGYEIFGVDDFYKNIGGEYKNPHLDDIKNCILKLNENINFGRVLDLGAGLGEVSSILMNLNYYDIVGCDPYLYKEYENKTGLKCLKYSFSDIQMGKLDNMNFDTVIASYSLHLSNISILPDVLWKLSLISDKLIILSPNNNPKIHDNGWLLMDSFKIGKCKVRYFKSLNT